MMDYSPKVVIESVRPDAGPSNHANVANFQTSSFVTEGFTSYSNQRIEKLENKITMENMQKMLQELYKALTEKVVMENAAMFAALKKENTHIKELEDLRKEVPSTYLSKVNPFDTEKVRNVSNYNTQTSEKPASQPGQISPLVPKNEQDTEN